MAANRGRLDDLDRLGQRLELLHGALEALDGPRALLGVLPLCLAARELVEERFKLVLELLCDVDAQLQRVLLEREALFLRIIALLQHLRVEAGRGGQRVNQ